MSSGSYFENIQRSLFLYADRIANSNSLALQSEATLAENFFCAFLNKAFGWELVNVNELQLNYTAFDLVDFEKGIAVQVTSNKQFAGKRKSTVTAFETNRDPRIKHVIILFISVKCPKTVLEIEKKGDIKFEGYDIPKLLKKVHYANQLAEQLKELNTIAEGQALPILLNGEFPIAGASYAKDNFPKQTVTVNRNGIYIDRKPLIQAIFSFAQTANGLVIGGPGYGKSVVLSELKDYCEEKEVPCFLIKINELLDGTDDEINRELGSSIYWIDALKKISFRKKESKGILIFDAFDTAKEEYLKRKILKHIKTAIEQLKANWNILASVRTFEASKSSQLRELFPQSALSGAVSTRLFAIPALTDEELDSALKKDRKLESIAASNGTALRTLLKIPYFLKLLEAITSRIDVSDNEKKLSIETEEQLLDVYWNGKVETTPDEIFLHLLTRELVKTENLSCPKSDFVTELNSASFDRMISSGVIAESSVTKQNISFSHNILLEFAISKFVIPEDPAKLVQYLSEHQKLAFLFRQSFIYFYSRMWKKGQPLFWKHYYAIREVDSALFRLVHQTILNYVVCLYYRQAEELTPVFEVADDKIWGGTVRKILEAIRFITAGKPRENDVNLLLKVSERMHILFLWELGVLINQAIEINAGNQKKLKILSRAALNYMLFVLAQRLDPNNKFLAERNGGNWGIDNMIRTISFTKAETRKKIKEILLVLQEPDFPISWFYLLGDKLISLAASDIELAVHVYKTIYYHTETSNKETYLGNSVVISLRSNRKQDFGSIHHKLESDFAELLKARPFEMIPVGVGIVNKFSLARRYYGKNDKPMPLLIEGIKSKITSDFSFYDSDHDKEYGHASFVQKIMDYLVDELTKGNTKHVCEIVMLVIKHAEASLVWRRLISVFIRFPEQLKQESFATLLNMPIYICNETVHEAGELIKVLWSLLSKPKRRALEQIILGIKDSGYCKNDSEFAEHRIKRLLGCIPAADLQEKESKLWIIEKGTRQNDVLLTKPKLMAYTPTEAEEMRRTGVEPDNAKEQKIYEGIKTLKAFNDVFFQEKLKPTKNEFSQPLKLVKEFFVLSRNGSLNEKLAFAVDEEISEFARAVARNGNTLDRETKKLIIAISVTYISETKYQPETYELGETKSHTAAWGPNPRVYAADALGSMLMPGDPNGVKDAVLGLMTDRSQIIRLRSISRLYFFWKHYREEFWTRIMVIAIMEHDGMSLQTIVNFLTSDELIKDDLAKVESTIQMLNTRFAKPDEELSYQLWQGYVILLLRLVLHYDSQVAKDLLYQNLHLKSFARQLIYEVLGVIDPHAPGNNYATEPQKHTFLFALLKEMISVRLQSVKAKGLGSDDLSDDFETIDTFIEHLYYTINSGKKANKNKAVTEANRRQFYVLIKPLLTFIVDESQTIGDGFMVARTGYHFMQTLNHVFDLDPAFILHLSSAIVKCAAANGFTYDQTTLREIVKLTEKVLADHKELLLDTDNFYNLIAILDLFANSGWQEALELTWRIKEIF